MTKCPAQKYCESSTASLAAAIACPDGNFCPEGSSSPTPCLPGQYSNSAVTDKSKCLACELGKYCPYNTVTGTLAENGYITKTGGLTGPEACLPGTFKSSTDPLKCLDCPEKKYCDEYAIQGPVTVSDTPERNCPAGYYCTVKTTDYS